MTGEIREGFIRQRRNLMIMSIVMFFAQYVGLEFKQINFLGNQAEITDSSSVIVFLWFLLWYWLVRYGEYLHELGNLGIRDRFFSKRKDVIRASFEKKDYPKTN